MPGVMEPKQPQRSTHVSLSPICRRKSAVHFLCSKPLPACFRSATTDFPDINIFPKKIKTVRDPLLPGFSQRIPKFLAVLFSKLLFILKCDYVLFWDQKHCPRNTRPAACYKVTRGPHLQGTRHLQGVGMQR